MRVPPFVLFLLFTLVPLLEVWLLVEIGGSIGLLPTLALVIGTGFVGASLARSEGARVLGEWQEATSRGELPREGLVSGLLVLVGGILLITPGVITDVAGLLLLFPPTRRLVASRVQARMEQRFTVIGPGMGVGPLGGAGPFGPGFGPGFADGFGPGFGAGFGTGDGASHGAVIDVEATVVVDPVDPVDRVDPTDPIDPIDQGESRSRRTHAADDDGPAIVVLPRDPTRPRPRG